MAAPYTSSRRLVGNSISAMLCAIEVYNKPTITYRDEVTVILAINAWELALKAALRQGPPASTIYYRKKHNEPYRSFSLGDALQYVSNKRLWPPGMDGQAVAANVRALEEYRDRSIHLYNADGLGKVLYLFLQQCVTNYRDFVMAKFSRDLAQSITWQLLPLGASAPRDPVEFMRVDTDSRTAPPVQAFIDELRRLLDQVDTCGGDLSRVATVYDTNLNLVRNLKSADLSVAVVSDANGQIATKRTDSKDSHPFNMTDLLDRVNQRRSGRKLSSYDFQAICWKEELRLNGVYAWKHPRIPSHFWSNEAVSHLAGLGDDYYDQLRLEYRRHNQEVRAR